MFWYKVKLLSFQAERVFLLKAAFHEEQRLSKES